MDSRKMSAMTSVSAENHRVADEYEAVRDAAAIRYVEQSIFVRVTGDDRISFFHGMCTADIKSLKPGSLTRALLLTERAHIIGEFTVYAMQDNSLMLEIERAAWPAVRTNLEKFLVADDVEFEELDSLGAIDLEGREAVRIAAALASDAAGLEPWRHLTAERFVIANAPQLGVPGFSVAAQRDEIPELIGRIQAQNPSIGELSADTLELLRVEQGIARIGVDTNDKTLALEARLDFAISFNKGCYVGQETVERATARGALKRRLYGLKITSAEIPPQGAPLMLDGKDVGRLSSVVRSPALGVIGLSILHHSAWKPGTEVALGDGLDGSAIVSELPFELA
jgi:folate-binding protein YgfZ